LSDAGAFAASLSATFARAVASFDLGALVAAELATLERPRRARLIAVGKAAPAMTRGAFSVWNTCIERALVVAPDGTPPPPLDPRIELLRAAHPIPDERSVVAASRALDLVRGAEVTVALISGGASALLCAPHDGVTLAAKRDVTRALLASGADIRAINVVRRHLSRIKGGGLARAAWPGRVIALLASDVLAGPGEDVRTDIGSGPTVPDATTTELANAILARHGIPAPASLHETLKPGEPAAAHQTSAIIASPGAFAAHLAAALAPLRVRQLDASTLDIHRLAAEYLALAATLQAGEALVRCAEPSLEVPANTAGTGGRASHLAALVARALPAGVAFLAGATDGVDGPSPAAGASVHASTFTDRAAVDAALRDHATGDLHARAGSAIVLGPTGLNFSDIHVLARAPLPPARP
jgi:glycerate 2-kinase